MTNIKKHEAQTQQKVQTKYDRKMEARRQQKESEAKQNKLGKIIGAVIGIAVVVAIVAAIAIPVLNKNAALKDTYIKVGKHELTKLEYDYYYKTSVSGYMSTYSSIIPYLGLDTSVDFEKQEYADGMTWKDLFDEMTVGQIKQTKALVDDAMATEFSYDVETDYEEFTKSIDEAAASSNKSATEFYKENFGAYATKANIASFVKDTIIANAYYNSLMSANAPDDTEIKNYYEENKQQYDRTDYRSYVFADNTITGESTEAEIAKAMETLKAKADAMMQARKEGKDFETLCIENASEEEKVNYEDAETEYCLSEGKRYSETVPLIGDWLFEDARKEMDIAVLADETSHRYYVTEFVKRYYDDADNETIANTIAGRACSEYVDSLIEKYEIEDIKGDLKYLLIAGENAENQTADDAPADENLTE